MAREINRLSPARVRAETKPGMYGDGCGLWLHVGPSGGKSWIFRFMLKGRSRQMGLGATHTIGLAEARDAAREARKALLAGTDPLAVRQAARAAERAEAAAAVTFRQAAERYIASNRPAWKSAKHAGQWAATLQAYAHPLIGDLPVAAITTGHVTAILEPIWTAKPETAARVRGRLETVLDYARAHGWRHGENPARWRGHLQNILPARGKVAKVEHHAALPWREIGAFMETLKAQEGLGAIALRLAILTATRTSEALNATWSELDLGDAIWTIPPARMKAGKTHRIPLAPDVMALLRDLLPLRDPDNGDWVFPGGRKGKPLSTMAMLMTLRRMGRGDLTAHGFRSTFRDWVAEATSYPRELAEAALAHTLGSAVEQAYLRSDLLEKRRRLMLDWATFCAKPAAAGGVVVPIRGEATA